MKLVKFGLKILASNFKTLNQPYKLTFAVTYHCDSRCKICNIWNESGDELTLEEIKRFFSKNKFLWINLTGGEVFLREDILEIVRSLRGTFFLNITTNGIQTHKIVEDCKKIKDIIPKFILTVSIDGPRDLHNKLRGVNCWDKAVQTYQNIRNLGIESYIGHTVSPYNVGVLEKTFEEIKKVIPSLEMKDFHINFYHESDIYFNNRGRVKRDEEYVKKLKREVKEFIGFKKGLSPVSCLETRYLELVETYLDRGVSPLPCKALSSSCFVDPQGVVYPCTIYDMKLGNLRDVDFELKRIWDSERASKVRELIRENKCPGCWTPCEAYQTILGNLLRV